MLQIRLQMSSAEKKEKNGNIVIIQVKMKKTIITSMLVLALVGCAKEVAHDDNTPKENVKYMTFDAVLEDDVTDLETKATLDRSGVFSWDSSETIYFIDADGTTATGTYDASTQKVTVEEGEWVTASSSPLSSAGKLVSLSGNGPVVVAKVDGPILKFHHIGSVVKVKFASIPLGCTLSFISNSAKGGDGSFTFNGAGVPTLEEGSNDVVISTAISASDDPVDVTISVPNLNYTGGFTVQLSVGGKAFYQKSTSKDFDLSERPTLLNMKQLTLPVYTVCGSKDGDDSDPAGIFGNTWDPTTSSNDLVLDNDGYYKKSYTNANANIILKVVQDRDWDKGEWPTRGADNKTYDTGNNGSDFTVKFNPVDNSIDFVECQHAYVVAGSFTSSWTVSSSNRLSSYNPTTLYKRFSDIDRGTIEYKFVKNYLTWTPSTNIYQTVSKDDSDIIITYYTNSNNYGFFQEGTHTVVGETGLTGGETGWDVNNNDNDMSWTEEDFIVAKTFSQVLPGDRKFKVVVNHSWDENYGGTGDNTDGDGNYVFNLTSQTDVTIKFNILTHAITVEY